MRKMALLMDLKDFTWVMSEYAGRERAVVAGRLSSGQGLTPEDIATISQYRGRIDMAWGKISSAREQSQVPDDIAVAIDRVNRDFFGILTPIRQKIDTHRAKGDVPVTTTEWIASSTAAINTVLDMSTEIGRHTAKVAVATRLEKTIYLAAISASCIITIIIVFLSFRFAGKRIILPIQALTGQMTRLAAGDMNAHFATPYKDEIGEMVKAVDVFRQNAVERRRLEDREKADLATRAERQQKIEDATKRFDQTITAIIARTRSAVEHLHTSSESLSANAEQTQRQSSAVSAATEQASANVETVAAAGVELSASIQEISRQVQQSSAIVLAAATESNDANQKITGLADAVQKISQFTDLINDIASQTNLLALNATIESARAGEAGKGFAVVANEVKHLAGQTGRATEDIAQQIATVQAETRSAVAAIGGISDTIGRISELSTVIAGAVEEQGSATAEIARNVGQATAGTREVALNISGVAQAATETGRMAQGVFGAASELL
ncbi:MAG: HAMP domain-containing protein, partial [Magnetospirillum sp.]